MATLNDCLEFFGSNYFRQRLVLATLSGRAVRVKAIKEDQSEPGINGKLLDSHYENVSIYVCTYIRRLGLQGFCTYNWSVVS